MIPAARRVVVRGSGTIDRDLVAKKLLGAEAASSARTILPPIGVREAGAHAVGPATLLAMRGLSGVGVMLLVGCAAPSTPIGEPSTPIGEPSTPIGEPSTPMGESAARAASPISPPKPTCTAGHSVVYRRPFEDHPEELEVVFTCRDGRVTAASTIVPYEMLTLDPETGKRVVVRSRELEEGEPGVGSLDVAAFNASRNRIASEIDEGACRPPERHTWISIGIGTDEWRILCAYEHPWRPVAKALEDAIDRGFDDVDPRDASPPPPPDPALWPFGGEYWRDELGYYRERRERLRPLRTVAEVPLVGRSSWPRRAGPAETIR